MTAPRQSFAAPVVYVAPTAASVAVEDPCPECHPDRPDARVRYRCARHAAGAFVTLPVAGPQQWRPTPAYTFHCLGCDRPLCGEWGDPAWFSGEAPVTGYETLDDAGWAEVGEGWYCPECFHTCWDADEQPRLGRESSCAVCKEATTCKACGADMRGTVDCAECLYAPNANGDTGASS